MTGPSHERATLADRQYLRRPSRHDPWVPAVELELAEPPGDDDLRRAISAAVGAEPRFSAVPERTRSGVRWRLGARAPDPDVSTDGDVDTWRARLIDTAFEDGDLPLRVSVRDRSLLVAWRHAVSDAAGGIGLCSLLMSALRDVRLPDARAGSGLRRRHVGREVWLEAARPGAIRAFVDKVRSFGTVPHAELTVTGPPGPTSVARTALLTPGPAPAGESFTGGVVAAVAAACTATMGSDLPVTLLLPVNLRSGDRWFPAGNFVGNVELVFESSPSATTASGEVERARGPERLSAWWASAVREALPRGFGRRGEEESGRLERSAVVNNLGRVPQDLLPGCTSVVFHGPTAVDFPSVSLVGLSDRTTVCVRVREHQGGAAVAEALLGEIVARLRP